MRSKSAFWMEDWFHIIFWILVWCLFVFVCLLLLQMFRNVKLSFHLSQSLNDMTFKDKQMLETFDQNGRILSILSDIVCYVITMIFRIINRELLNIFPKSKIIFDWRYLLMYWQSVNKVLLNVRYTKIF